MDLFHPGWKNRMALREFFNQKKKKKNQKNMGHKPIMKSTKRSPLNVYPEWG